MRHRWWGLVATLKSRVYFWYADSSIMATWFRLLQFALSIAFVTSATYILTEPNKVYLMHSLTLTYSPIPCSDVLYTNHLFDEIFYWECTWSSFRLYYTTFETVSSTEYQFTLFFCHKIEKMASCRLFIMYFFNHGTTDIKQYRRNMRLFMYALRARGGLISSFLGFGW